MNRIGVIQYNQEASIVSSLRKSRTTEDVVDAISAIEYFGGGSRTHRGLNRANNALTNEVRFTLSHVLCVIPHNYYWHNMQGINFCTYI